LSRPLISVVVPFYQAEATLDAALESLAASAFGDFEVLLVDDASRDGGSELARDRERRDARFRYARNEENRGVAHARNRALEMATGEWLAFVDADDRVSADWLGNLLEDARASGAEVVIGRAQKVCEGAVGDYRMEGLKRRGALTFADIVFKDNSVLWNKLYARELIRRTGARFDEGLQIGEDLLFNFVVLREARGLFYGGKGTYFHCVDNPASVMRGTGAAGRVEQYARLLERLETAAAEAGLGRHPALRKVARDLLMDHYRSGTPAPDEATWRRIMRIDRSLSWRVKASVWRKVLRQRLAGRAE
jgi:glycosyltransferase involved in cell wall biosynthesis